MVLVLSILGKSLIFTDLLARQLCSSSDTTRLINHNFIKSQSYGHHAFSFIAPELWNTIPLAIRCIVNVDTFKSRLREHSQKLVGGPKN